jgi:hypothetical protein
VNREAFGERFHLTPADDFGALDGLANEFSAEAREAVKLCVALGGTADPYAGVARTIVGHLGEAGLSALVESFGDGSQVAPWVLVQAGRSFAELEGAVIAGLRRSLGDRRPVPLSTGEEYLEEPERPRRICDEAYMGLRELLGGETKFDFEVNAEIFLERPEGERDAEIVRFAKTGAFRSYLDGDDETNE